MYLTMLPEAPRHPPYCFGCRQLTSKMYADGSCYYGCALSPGLVKGSTSAGEDDQPHACDKYQKRGER